MRDYCAVLIDSSFKKYLGSSQSISIQSLPSLCGMNVTIVVCCCPVNHQCPRTEEQFQCHSGHCIPGSYRCDQDRDCSDASDEMGCPFQSCHDYEFRCNNTVGFKPSSRRPGAWPTNDIAIKI